ncbi:MAG: Spermidine synthase [Chthoniobacteraceae bacterium]|nr:Spermidine synthase [Chthoniobacteraceae bacterium]
MKSSARSTLVAAFLFVSGFCALIYQTVWLREFRLIFGASTAASAAVLGIFMGGLGLGSIWLGRRMERVLNPLAWYGNLELLIALTAAATPGMLWLARQAYIGTGGSMVLGPGWAAVMRLVLASLVLIVPTVLMGGTLPAVARAATSGADDGRRTLAMLYGTNTMGAVTGALVSTFFLIEQFGNQKTLWIACGLNAMVALMARLTARTWPPEPVESKEPGESFPPASSSPVNSTFVLFAAGAVGFAFMLMELVWYRMLSPLLGGSSFTFGLILAVALFGIGLGGWLYSWGQIKRPTLMSFGWTCALEALFIAIPFALGDRLAHFALALRGLGELGFGAHILGWSLVTAIVILPAAIVAGYQFPMLIALLGSGREKVARQTGHAYAANTAGAIFGSLAGGFGLLPLLTGPGLWKGMVALLSLLALVPALSALRRREFSFIPVLALMAGGLAFFTQGPTAVWRHSGIGAGRAPSEKFTVNGLRDWSSKTRRTIVWEAEGVESSVALEAASGYAFVINGKVDGNIRADAGTQVMGGLLPCLLRPATKAMVIGLGTGSTAGWLARTPEIERVDVVELEPAVLEISRRCAPANGDVLKNPKIRLSFGDAREALLTTSERYDIIFSEPSNPYRAGVASLFTREFYKAASGCLSGSGIFAQWVQGYEIDGLAMQTAYATLGSVFEHVQTWQPQDGDFLLIASHQPISLDAATLRARIATEPYRSALQKTWNVNTLEGFLAHHTANDSLCRLVMASNAAPATDDRNSLEFGFARQVVTRSKTSEVNSEIYQMAVRHGWQHCAVSGAIDWEAVDRERENSFRGSIRDWAPRVAMADEDGLRWRALRSWQTANFSQHWHAHHYEPASYSELWMLGTALASTADPDCWRFVSQIYDVSPGEAEALYARAFLMLDQKELAIIHFVKALELWRNDPWPSMTVVNYVLNKCQELAISGDRATARMLYMVLREPLCVRLDDHARLEAAFKAAVAAAGGTLSDPLVQEAFAQFGSEVPWQKPMLVQRALMLHAINAPEAIEAALNLQAFRDAEPVAFGKGLPEPELQQAK